MILSNTKMGWLIMSMVFCLACNSFEVAINTDGSLVVASTNTEKNQSEKEENLEPTSQTTHIYHMEVNSQVSNRYVHTTVLSKVKNYATKSQEATFAIVLPETAFISGFVMEIDGKNYTAYVKEKEEAKKTYEQAVASGQSAAHVAVSARDSNRFTVSINVEPQSKATFYLNYEELLKRQENRYELVINIHPGEPVKDLSVKVTIEESRKITDLKVPPLRSGNEIGTDKEELDPRADIKVINDTHAIVTFCPNLERQKEFARILGSNVENGLSGQFVVQYDVERDPQGGEVLIQDGYFVHFFAPSNLEPLPKHVVFVLDTSGSMYGQKIVQLRESMIKILEQLKEQDVFQLVEFNSNVQVLDIEDSSKNVRYPENHFYRSEYPPLNAVEFGVPYPADEKNIESAKSTISKLTPTGSTDIYTGLEVALHLVGVAKASGSKHQPMIIFLTDGDPNVRIRSTSEITTKITECNSGSKKSAIFTLAFGNHANKKFLQNLAGQNNGFGRGIYEGADASLQLQNFYKQVSSPLLANITFKYEPSTTSLTVTEFPIHFGGSELVVAGCYLKNEFLPPTVEARGRLGWVELKPKVHRSVTSVERLWAYLTVKQLLEKKEVTGNDEETLKKKALDVALKYQFVTPVSSLVVVKPNATNAVDTEAADKGHTYPQQYSGNTQIGMKGISGGYAHHQHYSGKARPLYAQVLTKVDTVQRTDSVNTFTSATQSFDTNILATRLPAAPPRYPTTYIPTPPSQPTSTVDVFAVLPWLKDILNNGALTLTKGNYKLGLYKSFEEKVQCSNAPKGVSGHCTLIHSCEKVHSVLVSKEVYEQHFCILKNEYAGVCCPDV